MTIETTQPTCQCLETSLGKFVGLPPRLDFLEDSAESITIVIDPQQNVILANDNAFQLYDNNGYPPAGRKCYALFLNKDHCDKSPDQCFIHNVLATNQSFSATTTHILPDNRKVLVSLNATPVFDSHKNVAHIMVNIQNITGIGQHQISNAHKRQETLCKMAPDGLFLVDAEGIITEVNDTWLRLFGYTHDEATGLLAVTDLLDEQQGFVYKEILNGLKNKNATSCTELKWFRKDGSSFWSRVRTVPAQWDDPTDDNSIGVGSIRDLSDMEDIHEKLEESARFRRTLLDSLGEGVLILKPDYTIADTNKGFLDICGLEKKNVLNQFCYKISHDSDIPCWETANGDHECPTKTAFETGKIAIATHRHKNKEGKIRYVKVNAFPLKNKAGKVYQVIETHNDITERKILEQRLSQAEKIESIGTLAGGIAHDFNNILTPIIGNAQLAMLKLAPENPLHDDLQEILNAGERAAKLVRQILAFSRRQVLEKKACDINAVINDLTPLLRRLIHENIRIDLELGSDLSQINADVTQIEQIILNLAVNARDSMPDGGRLLIETRNTDNMENICHTCGEVIRGPHVLLMVSDDGAGIPDDLAGKIFEPFFTTKGEGRGTGMGLSTVMGIMHQHHGHINFYSEPDLGTTFKVYFPKAQTTADAPRKTKIDAALTSHTGTETILFAEDDVDTRKITERILSRLGYTVIIAENGSAALKLFEKHFNTIDLLLTDIVMPDMGGRILAEKILARKPELPVIFMSGYSLNAVHHQFVLEKDVAYIQKPFNLDTISHKVRSVLDARPKKS
jgi:PAS domain S-box-containing protein